VLWRYGVLFVDVFPCGVEDAFCDCLFLVSVCMDIPPLVFNVPLLLAS